MKIRIVKASEPTFWYADKIGEVFEVTGGAYGDYFVNYGGRPFKYIVDTVDCEEFNETEAGGMRKFNELSYDELTEHVVEAVTALRQRAYHEGYKQGKFDVRIEGVMPVTKPAKSPQEIRDDIVAKAKRDVDDLKSEWNVRDDISGGKMRYIRGQYVCNEEFIVNREKRTVVCLLRWKYDNSLVSKGIAKCDPSDCFNASIGRAISLRRALGLEVPAEYFTAPQPTEVRVGDVVNYVGGTRGDLTVISDNERLGNSEIRTYLCVAESSDNPIKFIDDSRD